MLMTRRRPRLDILPNPALKHQVRGCPLLEGNMEQWIVCCSHRFFPLARRIAGEDSLAEDALQTSWLKILQAINNAYFDGPKACSWVGKIVANAARDQNRQRRRRRETPLVPIRTDDQSPADLFQERQMLALLREMVTLLPDTYRQVIDLRIYEELSTREIADRLHLTRSNVRVRLHRAVRLLQRSLDARLQPPKEKSQDLL